MAQNPTFEGENYRYSEGSDMYGEKAPQNFDNMASYRQATSDNEPPASGGKNIPEGKSYRYATEAIPEDEETAYDDPDVADSRKVNFSSNGNTKASSKANVSGQSFLSKYKTHLLIALVILFALLWIIFLALYIQQLTSPAGDTSARGDTGAISDQNSTPTTTQASEPTETPMSTTTAKILLGVPVGVYNQKEVKKYTLTNNNNMEVELVTLGARVNKLMIGGKDVVLGFNTDAADTNLTSMAESVFGSANGRVCDDLTNPFTFKGQSYNPGADYTEGGMRGLYKTVYDVAEATDNYVKFTTKVTTSDDGLPGEAEIMVTYMLDENKNILTVKMEVNSSGDSIIDMCNSIRFNLNGHNSAQDATKQTVMVDAQKSIENGMPKEIIIWADLTSLISLQEKFDGYKNVVSQSEPYDARLLLSDAAPGLRMAGQLQVSGTDMKVYTDQDIVQVYLPQQGATVQGKAEYGPKQGVAFIPHNYHHQNSIARITLTEGSQYISTNAYEFS